MSSAQQKMKAARVARAARSMALLCACLTLSAPLQAKPEERLKLTLHKLVLKPDARSGWDEDQSPPDLRVRLKAAGSAKGEWALVTPVAQDQVELTWEPPLEVLIASQPQSMTVYVEDMDDAKSQKVSTFRIKWSDEDVQAKRLRSYRSKTIQQFDVTLSPAEASQVHDHAAHDHAAHDHAAHDHAAHDHAQAAEGSKGPRPERAQEGLEGYQPSAPSAALKLSDRDLSGDMLDEAGFLPAAAKLYLQYMSQMSQGLELEAKETLVKLIHLYPKSHYAVRARRVLF